MKKLGRYTKVAGVGTAVASGAFTALEEFGGNNNHSTAKKVGKTAGSVAGAALGAKLLTGLIAAIPTIGPAIAPILGPTIGGVIGNWVGGGFSNDARRNRFKGKFGIDSLTGDYSVRQLKRFNRFKNGDLSALTAEDIRMLKRNGDYEKLKAIKAQTVDLSAGTVNLISNGKVAGRANGGWVSGPGGPKDDSVLVPTSNGEFIVNAQSAAANAELLKTINNSKTTITPRGNILNPLKVNGGSASSSSQNSSINFENGLNINLGGTIKLDLGNRTIGNIRPEDILSQNMINQIIKEIQKQINRGFNGEKQGIFKFA